MNGQSIIKEETSFLSRERKINNIEKEINNNKIWPDANILLIPSDIPLHYDMQSHDIKNLEASTTFNKVNNDYQNKLDTIIKNINSTNTSSLNFSPLEKRKEEHYQKIKYDMVLLPENISYASSLKSGKNLYKGVPILNGLINAKEESSTTTNIKKNKQNIKNTSLYIDNINNASNYRDKVYLFPFYEYKPYIANWIPNSIYKKDNKIIRGEGVIDFYLDIKKYKNVNEFESVYKWTTIICSEFYSYNYLKSLRSHDYDFIISQSSLGIFNHSHWMHANILLSQIINSNYLAVPIINISNSAPSYLIIDNQIQYYHEGAEPFNINMGR